MRASSFWDVTVPRAMTIYANVIFVVLWVGFIIALVVNREWLDVLWNWAQALPLVPKIIIRCCFSLSWSGCGFGNPLGPLLHARWDLPVSLAGLSWP